MVTKMAKKRNDGIIRPDSIVGVWPSGKATDFEDVAVCPPSQMSLLDSDMIESQIRVATIVDWLFAPPWLSIEEACFLSGWDRDTMLRIVAEDHVDLAEDGLIEKRSLRELQESLIEVLNWNS